MYSYSPIKQIQIKNFRNLGEVVLDFSESPIISLIGENESGKTSVVKAFGVCAMHCDPRSQKDYIRDGTQGFGVAIELDDGTQVIRLKTAASNRYTVKAPDGSLVFDATKLENEVPKAVQDVMGLIEEPETKELLHIRTYEDQLLFVVTPASTNYKVMYDALKISQITKAIKIGSTEANSLKAKINETDTSMLALSRSLSAIKTFDIEPLLNIKNKLQSESQLMSKLDRAADLIDSIESMNKQLGALSELYESGISTIDVSEIVRLNNAGHLLDEIDRLEKVSNSYKPISDLGSIDLAQINMLDQACERLDNIDTMSKQSEAYIMLAKAEGISEIEISGFERVDSLLEDIDRLSKLEKVYGSIDAEQISQSEFDYIKKIDMAISIIDGIQTNTSALGQIENYVEQVQNWMKSVGVATTSCPKCGEAVIVDLDLLK